MNNSTLHIAQYPLGPMQNLVYIVADLEEKSACIVDPAWDVPFLLEEVKKLGCTLDQIFLTHGHHDHVNGLPEIMAQYPTIPVYISKHEAPFLTPDYPNIQKTYNDQELHIGNHTIECIHTPGHTPGGQCFYFDTSLICGDTLFVNGCGRCDLPGGDANLLFESLGLLLDLPDDTVIYPGHSYSQRVKDTLGNQKKTNPYLKNINHSQFMSRRAPQ